MCKCASSRMTRAGKKTPVKENEGVLGWVFGGTWQFLPRKEKCHKSYALRLYLESYVTGSETCLIREIVTGHSFDSVSQISMSGSDNID